MHGSKQGAAAEQAAQTPLPSPAPQQEGGGREATYHMNK